MPLIRKLDDATIALIAAGEVVESPASVVKELVENAIDAGSQRIVVEALAGGKELIRVSDDGCGMGAEDALLCFERHATSKFRTLDAIATMGFRGEALAAIAAVSHVRLLTNESREETAATLVADGKAVSSVRTRGTTIEVRSLFHNTPARKKFQKSASGDYQAIVRCIEQLSLANPDIHFEVRGDNQSRLFPVRNLKERLTQITECTEWTAIEAQRDGVRLVGFVGAPQSARTTRSGQFWTINGRTVLCPTLSAAVAQGFSTLLDAKRFPLFALHLTLPHETIDVNVHPQKTEVRLSQERELFPFIARAVSKALVQPIQHMPWEPQPFVESLPAYQAPVTSEQRELFGASFVPIVGTWGPYVLVDRSAVPKELALGEGLVFVHRRKARALLLHEQLPKAQAIDLPTPLYLDITAPEALVLEQHLPELTRLGFKVQLLGPTRCVVEAMPFEGSFRELLDELKGKKPLLRAASSALSADPTPPAHWLGHFFALPNAAQCCMVVNPDET